MFALSPFRTAIVLGHIDAGIYNISTAKYNPAVYCKCFSLFSHFSFLSVWWIPFSLWVTFPSLCFLYFKDYGLTKETILMCCGMKRCTSHVPYWHCIYHIKAAEQSHTTLLPFNRAMTGHLLLSQCFPKSPAAIYPLCWGIYLLCKSPLCWLKWLSLFNNDAPHAMFALVPRWFWGDLVV